MLLHFVVFMLVIYSYNMFLQMLFNNVFCKFVVPLWVDECYDVKKKLSQYDRF